MPQTAFEIEFTYAGSPYAGLVRPLSSNPDSGYCVVLESENQELYLEILLLPASSPLEDWDFKCGEGEDASHYYDKELLEEIGEQVEAHLIAAP